MFIIKPHRVFVTTLTANDESWTHLSLTSRHALALVDTNVRDLDNNGIPEDLKTFNVNISLGMLTFQEMPSLVPYCLTIRLDGNVIGITERINDPNPNLRGWRVQGGAPGKNGLFATPLNAALSIVTKK